MSDSKDPSPLTPPSRGADPRFRVLVDNIDGIVWEADAADGAFTFVSKRAESVLGYPPHKWIEDSEFFQTIIHPDDRAEAMAGRARAAKSGTEEHLEYRVLTSDGRTVWIRDRIHVVCDESGNPAQLIGLIVDYTEQRLSTERQEAQHAVVRVMAESSTVVEAGRKILQSVCELLHWQAGLLWLLDDSTHRLRCSDVWMAEGISAPRFEQLSRSMLFEPGVGLPGRVWSTQKPAWISNVVVDPNFPRAPVANEEDLHGAFGFPIISGRTFIGVMEFYSHDIQEPDDELLRTMGTIGTQVGQFIVRKRFEEESQFRTLLLESQMNATVDGVLVLAPDLSILYHNSRLADQWNFSNERPLDIDSFIDQTRQRVRDPNAFEEHIRGLFQRPLVPLKDEIDLEDGTVLERYAAPLLGSDGTFYGRVLMFRDITPHRRIESILRESKERNEFLAEASALLGTSLDVRTTLQSFARLLVPRIADWCLVDVVDEEGVLRSVAWSHADPDRADVVRALAEYYGPDVDNDSGSARVVRTGQSELNEHVTPSMLSEIALDPRHFNLLRSLEIRSTMVVPLVARGRRLGAITVGSSSQPFAASDVSLLEDFASRAALAVDNARLFSERSHVARTLQQSLLPPVLPVLPGLELAARYLPAGQGNDVGGDFYDVYATGRDDWAVVIGDVCGKGSEAAAVTALARYTIRAASMQAKKPSRVLATLNEAMLRQRSDKRFCTVAYVRVRQVGDGIRVTIGCGGHPQPIVVRGGGVAEVAGVPGTLIGFFDDIEVTDCTIQLPPGDALVLYTDGVTEARNGDDVFGEERLLDLLQSHSDLSASAMAEQLEHAVLQYQSGFPRDDIAILVLKATV